MQIIQVSIKEKKEKLKNYLEYNKNKKMRCQTTLRQQKQYQEASLCYIVYNKYTNKEPTANTIILPEITKMWKNKELNNTTRAK